MATSLRDLVDSADSALRDEGSGIGEAAAALGNSARLLDRLLENSERARTTRIRDDLIRSLARPCERAANTWPRKAGRADALLGATIDAVGVFRDQLSADDRWALALRTAGIARRAADVIRTAGPYDKAPMLSLVVAAADQLRRLGANSPPHPDRLRSLDSPIPIGHAPTGMGAAETILELTASLVHDLNQPSAQPLSARQLVAAARAGEAVAAFIERGTAPASAAAGDVPADAVAHWTDVRQMLARFADGGQPGAWDRRLIPTAVQLCRTLDASDPGLAEAVTPTLSSWLPRLGDGIEWQWHRLDRPLLVPCGREPINEARVSAWLRRETFVAGPQERAEVARRLEMVTSAARQVGPHDAETRVAPSPRRGPLRAQHEVRLPLL